MNGSLSELRGECRVLSRGFFRRRYDCGHKGPRKFSVMVLGREGGVVRQTERCPECYIEYHTKHAIRCCLCGLPIMVSERVALYAPSVEVLLSSGLTFFEGNPIGCLRSDCGDITAWAGYWTDNGYEPFDFDEDGF